MKRGISLFLVVLIMLTSLNSNFVISQDNEEKKIILLPRCNDPTATIIKNIPGISSIRYNSPLDSNEITFEIPFLLVYGEISEEGTGTANFLDYDKIENENAILVHTENNGDKIVYLILDPNSDCPIEEQQEPGRGSKLQEEKVIPEQETDKTEQRASIIESSSNMLTIWIINPITQFFQTIQNLINGFLNNFLNPILKTYFDLELPLLGEQPTTENEKEYFCQAFNNPHVRDALTLWCDDLSTDAVENIFSPDESIVWPQCTNCNSLRPQVGIPPSSPIIEDTTTPYNIDCWNSIYDNGYVFSGEISSDPEDCNALGGTLGGNHCQLRRDSPYYSLSENNGVVICILKQNTRAKGRSTASEIAADIVPNTCTRPAVIKKQSKQSTRIKFLEIEVTKEEVFERATSELVGLGIENSNPCSQPSTQPAEEEYYCSGRTDLGNFESESKKVSEIRIYKKNSNGQQYEVAKYEDVCTNENPAGSEYIIGMDSEVYCITNNPVKRLEGGTGKGQILGYTEGSPCLNSPTGWGVCNADSGKYCTERPKEYPQLPIDFRGLIPNTYTCNPVLVFGEDISLINENCIPPFDESGLFTAGAFTTVGRRANDCLKSDNAKKWLKSKKEELKNVGVIIDDTGNMVEVNPPFPSASERWGIGWYDPFKRCFLQNLANAYRWTVKYCKDHSGVCPPPHDFTPRET